MIDKNFILGIDLGTTNSAVATMVDNRPELIRTSELTYVLPSVVHFAKDGAVIVGEEAKRRIISDPDRTIKSIKRDIGDQSYVVTIAGKDYNPQTISAMILQRLKNDAEAYLGTELNSAVITVPANYPDGKRMAVFDAAEIAGFDRGEVRLINEPTAATLAYGIGAKDNKKIFVYDFGGGTFDVSILQVEKEFEDNFRVLSTKGVDKLGGDDFDERLVNYMAEKFMEEHGVNLFDDPIQHQLLLNAAENAKIRLSSRTKHEVIIPNIVPRKGLGLNMQITRDMFDEMTKDLIERTREPVMGCLDEAGIKTKDIDDVLLVGGTTFIPAVRMFVKEIFDKKPFMRPDVDPLECVAKGAAVLSMLEPIIPEEELIKLPAAVEDVISMTLGIQAIINGVPDRFSQIISKQTIIPAENTVKNYSTIHDNQTNALIAVYQGEDDIASKNIKLGECILAGIKPAPVGVPKIDVTFKIDRNGILYVYANDDIGAEVSTHIEREGILSKREKMTSKKEMEKVEKPE